MSPIEKLDEVLKYIASKINGGLGEKYFYKELFSIEHHMKKIDADLELSELLEILQKLIDDKLVIVKKITPKGASKETDYYCITFEGRLFIEKGCYKQSNRRKIKAANLQSSQTWAIAVGTALAGAYGLWELLKEISSAYK